MTLLERVRDALENGRDAEQSDLLLECVRDGGAQGLAGVLILFEDDYGGVTFEADLKRRAACAFPAWGAEGLDTLLKAVLRQPKLKQLTTAIPVLAAAADGVLAFSDPKSKLGREIAKRVDANSMKRDARAALRRIALEIQDDDTATSAAATSLHGSSFIIGAGGAGGAGGAREIVKAFALRWVALGTPILKTYSNLLRTDSDNEKAFQRFLSKYPQLLDPIALMVWSQPDLHGMRAPDFVLRRQDNAYVVVEIECPSKLIVTQSNQLSAETTHAVKQAEEYREYLNQRHGDAVRTFPEFQDPECLVVIGMEEALTPDQRACLDRENRSRHRLRIVGFDWLANRAEAITNNLIDNTETIEGTRLV